MELTPYLNAIREDVMVASKLGNEEAQQAIRTMLTALDPAMRLALIQALSDGADEITHQLRNAGAPALVRITMSGRDPNINIESYEEAPLVEPEFTDPLSQSSQDYSDESTARITLRLPNSVKQKADEAARLTGMSLNAFLVDCIRRATDPPLGQFISGYVKEQFQHGIAQNPMTPSGVTSPSFTSHSGSQAKSPKRLTGWI